MLLFHSNILGNYQTDFRKTTIPYISSNFHRAAAYFLHVFPESDWLFSWRPAINCIGTLFLDVLRVKRAVCLLYTFIIFKSTSIALRMPYKNKMDSNIRCETRLENAKRDNQTEKNCWENWKSWTKIKQRHCAKLLGQTHIEV